MIKFLSLLVTLSVIGFIASNCKTSQRTTVPKKVEFCEIPKSFEDVATITYLPPTDSISEVTINLVGDLMCHLPQTNNARLASGEFDFNPSFDVIRPFLQDADYTIGNLETTFAGTVQPYAGYPAFNSPDAYCTALKNAGFDFLVTANNHSMDTREHGLLRTIDVIRKHSLGYTGTYLNQQDRDSIRIIDIHGVKLAILNYTYGTNGAYPSKEHKYMLNVIDSSIVGEEIKSAKMKGADMVLVFYHMGQENISEPTQPQKDAVRYALDAGASLVIGAHPHVVGPTEKVYSHAIHDTAFVAYSLGNFISNQYWRYTDAGVILKVTISKNHRDQKTKFKSAGFIPTWVYRGDGKKKMHILFPSEWANDSTKLPDFITKSHVQKMKEAFEDTRMILTKNNPSLQLIQ